MLPFWVFSFRISVCKSASARRGHRGGTARSPQFLQSTVQTCRIPSDTGKLPTKFGSIGRRRVHLPSRRRAAPRRAAAPRRRDDGARQELEGHRAGVRDDRGGLQALQHVRHEVRDDAELRRQEGGGSGRVRPRLLRPQRRDVEAGGDQEDPEGVRGHDRLQAAAAGDQDPAPLPAR